MNYLFTIDNNYIDTIKTLLFSIYTNMGEGEKFYFIFQNICSQNREEIIEFAKTKCKGRAVFIEYQSNVLDELPTLGGWSKEIYLRLFSAFILKDLDMILYLDGDTIVNDNLAELFLIKDFDDYAFAAVPNDVQDFHKERLGLKAEDTYVNSGVLLINLKKIRQMFSPEQIENLLTEYKDKLLFPDQDFINIVFKKNIKLIDIRYNYMINLAERNKNYPHLRDFKVCHYVFEKPWNEEFPYKTDHVYFKYLFKRKQIRQMIYLWYRHRKVRMVYKIKGRL